jgi:hypothetical protein
MPITIDGGAGITFPDTVQQTNGMTNTGGDPRYYAARAWVTFDGSATPPTILSATNVASVSRTSTGKFTITFTTNMPNANYAVMAMGFYPSDARQVQITLQSSITVSQFSIFVIDHQWTASSPNNNLYNSPRISLAVFA